MRRVLELEIIGNSRGAEAMLNRLNGSLTNTGRGTRNTTKELGLMDRQLMAIGTTARYALAGSLVFGITGAIARLEEFNNQLGTTAGLLTQMGQGGNIVTPSNAFIQKLGDEAQLAANRVGIATDDVQSYMTRFFSTFQENPHSHRALTDMRGFVNEVTRLQALMGAEAGDPQVLAGGIAGFVNQIPGGRRNIPRATNRVANLVTFLTAQTPNITGRNIATDIGRIGATMGIGNLTPEQTFAIWGQAGKAGGSASVIGRGIAQMLGTLFKVTTPAQKLAFGRAGLPTDANALRQLGAMTVLSRLMRSATTGRVGVGRRGLLMAGDEDTNPAGNLDAAGLRGINLSQVYGAFGRQESARQFVNLLAQGGVKGLQDYIRAQKKAEDANLAFARENEALRYRMLARFTQARQGISLSLARGIDYPLEHVVAPPVIAASNFLARHQAARVATDAVFAALLLRSGLRHTRLGLPGGRFAKLLGNRGGGLAGAAITAEEMPALVSGQGTGAGGAPIGSRADPIWVMISPASWFVGSPGGMSAPVGGTPGRFKIPPIVPFIGPAAVTAAVLASKGDMGGWAPKADQVFNNFRYGSQGMTRSGALGGPLLNAMRFAHMAPGSARQIYFTGQADADLTIRLVDAQGRTITVQEHKGVPFKFTGPTMPTSQGKPGKKKGHN